MINRFYSYNQPMSPPSEPGRRERKRLATRARLEQAAQQLFLSQGFEHTTVDEIAAAAGVSRRTFFNYFDTKEAVLFGRYVSFEEDLARAIRAAPPGLSALELAEHAVTALLSDSDPEEAQAFEQIKRDVPALQERDRGKYEWLERTVADALAERTDEERADLRMQLDAMVITTVLRASLDAWVAAATAGISAGDLVHRVVRMLEASLDRS